MTNQTMIEHRQIPATDSKLVLILLFLLSVIAGTTDIIGFLGLNGLFTAHITGNLVLLCARVAGTGDPRLASILSIPVFLLVVGLTRILSGRLVLRGFGSLCPLLVLQFVLLTGFLILCTMLPPNHDPNTALAIVAGMLGVSAMAVQNAIVQLSIKEAPSTAIMTSNVTRFALDVGTVLLKAHPNDVDKARKRASLTWPVIVGFALGCAIGAACQKQFGMTSLALPTLISLVAVTLGFVIEQRITRANKPS